MEVLAGSGNRMDEHGHWMAPPVWSSFFGGHVQQAISMLNRSCRWKTNALGLLSVHPKGPKRNLMAWTAWTFGRLFSSTIEWFSVVLRFH